MSTGAPIEKNVHMYDGWNLIGEMNVSGSLIREYVWELDLSDTEQGAGGVGALLTIDAIFPYYYPTYVADCNVTARVEYYSGARDAVYDYAPFGGRIRATSRKPKAAEVGGIVMELLEKHAAIQTKDDLAVFIGLLRENLKDHPEKWENADLDAFLDAMQSWVGAMEGYYRNHDREMPDPPTWRVFGDILLGARVYE